MQLRANELQQQLGVLQKKMLRQVDEVPRVLQCVAVCCSVLQKKMSRYVDEVPRVLQCGAVFGSVVQCVAEEAVAACRRGEVPHV